MTDSELKVGLAFHGISCVAAFAILLYIWGCTRQKAIQHLKILRHCSPASAALTTQSSTSRLPSTPAPVVVYNGGLHAGVQTCNRTICAQLPDTTLVLHLQ